MDVIIIAFCVAILIFIIISIVMCYKADSNGEKLLHSSGSFCIQLCCKYSGTRYGKIYRFGENWFTEIREIGQSDFPHNLINTDIGNSINILQNIINNYNVMLDTNITEDLKARLLETIDRIQKMMDTAQNNMKDNISWSGWRECNYSGDETHPYNI